MIICISKVQHKLYTYNHDRPRAQNEDHRCLQRVMGRVAFLSCRDITGSNAGFCPLKERENYEQ
jgi:hypothetical protein